MFKIQRTKITFGELSTVFTVNRSQQRLRSPWKNAGFITNFGHPPWVSLITSMFVTANEHK